MSRYRKTMSEAMAEVQKISEAGYLEPKMNPRQIQNIKKIWQFKTKKDLTPAVIKMIKNMDPVTQGAIKDAGINLLSDIAEGRMSEIDAMQKAGKSAAEIAKLMKLPVKTVKAILGEQETDSAQDMQDVKPGKDKIKETIDTLLLGEKGVVNISFREPLIITGNNQNKHFSRIAILDKDTRELIGMGVVKSVNYK